MSNSALQHAPADAFAIAERPANDARPSESLVALTHDELLRETLRAVAPEHVLSFANDQTELARHLHDEPAGVAFLDSAALSEPAGELTARLRSQFPDLVLIVAGGPEDQTALARQVTNGTVYRFLHKPVSAQRVKLFVDAAWRRHDVEHAATGTFAALQLQSPLRVRLARSAPWLGLAALALIVSAALTLVLRDASPWHPGGGSVPPSASTEGVLQLLGRADAALAAGALVSPPARNAADLYRQALRADASNARAHEGLQRVADGLLTAAEQALLAGRTDQARQRVDAARSIEPDNVRIAFLTAQIDQERERALLPSVGAAAAKGVDGHALARSAAARDVQPAAGTATRPIDVESRVSGFLRQAESHMRSGALLAPAGNNAQFFVDAAAALAPGDPAVRKAQRALAQRLLTEAHSAARAGDASETERWAQAASDAGASSEQLAAVRQSLQDAEATAKTGSLTHIAQLFNQRLAEGRLLDPSTDSARFYLGELEASDPTHPSTVLARTALATRLLEESRRALATNDWAAAREWLTEARVVGVDARDASAVEREIAAARVPSSAASILPELTLKKVRYVAPIYPSIAEQLGRSGIVELQFTVQADGSVADIDVTRAEPAGMFESAAIEAVRQWRYEPVVRNGHPVAQRVTLHVTFKP